MMHSGVSAFRFLVLSIQLGTCLVLTPPSWADPSEPLVEPPPLPEFTDPAAQDNPEPTVAEDASPAAAPAPVSPSVQISGAIWRSKPGIVFLQTPIGPLSLSSKTTLRDIKTSQKITLWVHGTTSVIDIRERGIDKLVHRYVSGMPNFTSPEKTAVTFWTPDGEQSFALGSFQAKIAGRQDHQPVAIEVDGAGTIKGLHDVQFDLQVNQLPRTPSPLQLLLNGTVSKLKSNYVFLKTPLGIVTVSGKTGVKNAKVGQEMSVWIRDRHVAIDLYQDGLSTPSRRFLSGPLTYGADGHDALTMQGPEGSQAIPLTTKPSSLATVKEGWPITVELNQKGELVEIRRVN
ncbi:MAG: hypothetical protein WAS50_04005 [Nitrospira sp.]|jgi:hypothetical protein